MAKYYYSAVKQKIVLLLVAGVVLHFQRSPTGVFRILKTVAKDWQKINRAVLYRTIREFRYNRLIDYKENNDGVVTVILSKLGEKHALKYQLDEMKVAIPPKWDHAWRIVIFDIPEKKKRAREALRKKLKELGFTELQKSVFIFPYECENEIDFICEVFEIRNHVRYIKVAYINNEAELKLKFGFN